MANMTNILELAAKLGLHNLSRQKFKIQDEGLPNLDFLEYVFTNELELRGDKRALLLKKKAHLSEEKRLENFDLNMQTGIAKWQLDKLKDMSWLDGKYNLLLMGDTGTGKSHLAIGLAMEAIRKGNKAFYATLDNLLFLLKTKETISKSRIKLNYISECRLIILDEVGYLPLSAEDAKTVYSFIDSVNKKLSLIIITNREFDAWKDLFHDEVVAMTLLDRITEKCQVIKLTGELYRFLNHKNICTKEAIFESKNRKKKK